MDDREGEILWRRFGVGDRAAFAELYRRHEQDVLRFCHAVLRDEDDAREAANSTWASIWAARHAATRDIPQRPWLLRIARNEAIDVLRRRRPHEHEQLDAELAGPDDPEADAELHERLATLHADLLSLPERQRSALVLREMSGLSHVEIAAVLGTSPPVAKQTIYEARQALADAASGRALDHVVVRRAIAAGDQRVLRGRRIRAHLRSCAACREFATRARDRGGGLRMLVPLPLLAPLLPRLGGAAEAAVGGRSDVGGLWGSLSALGASLGGSVVGKLAVATAVVAVGARGERLVTRGGGAPDAVRPAAAEQHDGVARTAAPRRLPSGLAGRGDDGPMPFVAGGTRIGTVAASPVRSPSRTSVRSPSRAAVDDAASAALPSAAASPAVALPPAQAEQAGAATVPPGRARQADASAEPPGQAERHAAKPVPPGQTRKDRVPTATMPAAAVPPPTAVATPIAPAPPPRATDAIANGNGPDGLGPPGQLEPKP
jgi:RNA polymerase sigma factor (sigma-70 family)